jgi:hypothetical protein
MFRLRVVAVLVASLAALCFADEVGFQKLGPALNEFRAGSANEISIRFTSSTFQVMRLTETALSGDQAKQLLPKKPSFPTLKISQEGNWIEHTVDQDTSIDEPLTANGAPDASREWKKLTWIALGSFDRAAWSRFVEFAIANGLCGIEETRYKGRSLFTLSFAPIIPSHIAVGGRTLVLNSRFGSVMRLSPKYPAKTGGKGFVILLHDPHENVAGRFETLTGLRSLTSANSSVSFRFLVEGAYKGTSREVGFSGLDTAIKPGADTSPAVVHSLLSRYLINTPMAYRLLYDQKISTRAIDNNDLLAYPAPRPMRSLIQQADSLTKISQALDKAKLPEGASRSKSGLQGLLNLAFVYLTADLQEAPDTTLVDYYGTLAELYKSIGKIGRLFDQAGFKLSPADLQALVSDANGCEDEAAIYKKASERNKTMAPLIIEAAMSASDQVPIAFIGSYHTHGIVAELEKASIGYVVLEPRPRITTSEAENRAFARANHSNTRPTYLSTVPLDMGLNGPTTIEVKSSFQPKIAAKIPEVRKRQLAAQAEFKAIPGATVDIKKLTTAANTNGSLASVRIASGGHMPPPPGKFGGTFAYFEPDAGGSGSGSRFIVTDPTDKRWNEGDRYEFLSVALFRIPDGSREAAVGTSIMFYPDPTSNRLFFTFYEPTSRRIYCFEGDPQRAALLVPTPIGDSKAEQNLRMQVVEVMTIHQPEAEKWLSQFSRTKPGT